MKGVLGGPGESPCWTLTSLLPSPWSTRLLSISCLLRGEESYDSTRLSSYSYVMTYRFKSVSKSESSLPIISLSVMSSIAVLIKMFVRYGHEWFHVDNLREQMYRNTYGRALSELTVPSSGPVSSAQILRCSSNSYACAYQAFALRYFF